ncbi:MAG: helix-turn-helix transcriptional regulator [bacterium]
MTNIAENLKFIRQSKGFTQKDLALLTSMSNDYISKIEKGTATNIGIDKLSNLASALGVRIVDLINGPQDPITTENLPLDRITQRFLLHWHCLEKNQKDLIIKILQAIPDRKIFKFFKLFLSLNFKCQKQDHGFVKFRNSDW